MQQCAPHRKRCLFTRTFAPLPKVQHSLPHRVYVNLHQLDCWHKWNRKSGLRLGRGILVVPLPHTSFDPPPCPISSHSSPPPPVLSTLKLACGHQSSLGGYRHADPTAHHLQRQLDSTMQCVTFCNSGQGTDAAGTSTVVPAA